jgi:hypothetical protein
VNCGWLTETIDDEPAGCVDVDDDGSVIVVNLEYHFTSSIIFSLLYLQFYSFTPASLTSATWSIFIRFNTQDH